MKLATSDTPALEIKPSRRSKAGAAKRQLIMTAALELFSLYGFHGTSLDQVAERADVSKTNLLYYFPSKEALYIAVLKRHSGHLARTTQSITGRSAASRRYSALYCP